MPTLLQRVLGIRYSPRGPDTSRAKLTEAMETHQRMSNVGMLGGEPRVFPSFILSRKSNKSIV